MVVGVSTDMVPLVDDEDPGVMLARQALGHDAPSKPGSDNHVVEHGYSPASAM
jgi:hypothetical protein